MPCYYEPSEEELKKDRAEKAAKEKAFKTKVNKQKKELDKVTRLLCEIMTEHGVGDPSPELEEWWYKHQKIDAKRKARKK